MIMVKCLFLFLDEMFLGKIHFQLYNIVFFRYFLFDLKVQYNILTIKNFDIFQPKKNFVLVWF